MSHRAQNFITPANLLTLARFPLSAALLFLRPLSGAFYVVYTLCGLTDVLDGFAARLLHEETELGAKLDSAADLLFAVAWAVRLLPLLKLPVLLWVWTAGIAAAKLLLFLWGRKQKLPYAVLHTKTNKLTGFLLFLLPYAQKIMPIMPYAVLICAAATAAALQECLFSVGLKSDGTGGAAP